VVVEEQNQGVRAILFLLKLPIFLLLAPVVWIVTIQWWFIGDPTGRDTWIAFVQWLRGSPPGYRYPDHDDKIDPRPYDRL